MSININLTDQIYNSIIIFSFLNFLYLYLGKSIIYLYNLKVPLPLVFLYISNSYINQTTKETDKEIIHCYNSNIHASIMLLFSFLYVFSFINIEFYNNILNYSVIYNTIDIYYLINYNSKVKTQMIFHHILIIISIIIRNIIPLPKNYNYYIALNFFSEITTIPLNISWILYTKNLKKSLLFKLSMVSTLILYIPFRVLLNTYLFYDELSNLHTNIKYFQLIMVILNYFWFYKLCKLVYKNITN